MQRHRLPPYLQLHLPVEHYIEQVLLQEESAILSCGNDALSNG